MNAFSKYVRTVFESRQRLIVVLIVRTDCCYLNHIIVNYVKVYHNVLTHVEPNTARLTFSFSLNLIYSVSESDSISLVRERAINFLTMPFYTYFRFEL